MIDPGVSGPAVNRPGPAGAAALVSILRRARMLRIINFKLMVHF